jgi:hypothetical protein
MERQFRDRIRMDDGFLLRHPEEEQILGLYRSRVESWLQDDTELHEKYRLLNNPFEPFSRDRVLELAGQQSIRDILEQFDREFHKTMCEMVVEPEFDLHFYLNELRPLEGSPTDFEYTAGHLETARELLLGLRSWLPQAYGVVLIHAPGEAV